MSERAPAGSEDPQTPSRVVLRGRGPVLSGPWFGRRAGRARLEIREQFGLAGEDAGEDGAGDAQEFGDLGVARE